MDKLHEAALYGFLASPVTTTRITIRVENLLSVPVKLVRLNDKAKQVLVSNRPSEDVIRAGIGKTVDSLAKNYIMVLNNLTGSFITLFEVPESDRPPVEFKIDPTRLSPPNNIGIFPEPNREVIIPPDSPRVLVGCGVLKGSGSTAADGNIIVREQYWERMSDSYSLAAGEQKTLSSTTTEGTETTSSSTSEMAVSLGLDASAGWGPVSASASATLSSEASHFQQVTVTEQSTLFASDTLSNETADAVMYLKWQLTDVITVFTSTGVAKSSVMMGENPIIIAGPYNPSKLGSPPPIITKIGGPPLLQAGSDEAASTLAGTGAQRDAAPVRRAKSSKAKS